MWTAGQVIGLIHDVPSCEVLVKRIEKEAADTLKKATSLLVDHIPEGEVVGKEVQDPNANPTSEHGSVGKDVNNPEAQVWGIGKSKL